MKMFQWRYVSSVATKHTCKVAKHVPCLHGCVEEKEEFNNAKAKWSSRQNTDKSDS